MVGSFPYGLISLPYAASSTFDLSTGNTFTMTLTGNLTTMTVTNPTPGHMYTFIFYQDGTGLHSVSWPANFHGVITIPITALANTIAAQTVVYDGTNFVADSIGLLNI